MMTAPYQRSYGIHVPHRRLRRGFGDAELHQEVTSGITTGLSVAAAVDPEPISKGLLAIAAGLSKIMAPMFAGCGNTCVAATQIVNQIEPYLKQNRDTYLSAPVHYVSLQQQALATFDDTWAKVMSSCSNPALGDAGQRCISDRQRGGKWDWFSYYRDPIANDPNVVPDPVPPSPVQDIGGAVQTLLGPSLAADLSNPNLELILGALLLLAVLL